jgi:hypothetical protein
MNYNLYKSRLQNLDDIISASWDIVESTNDKRIELQALDLIRNVMISTIDLDHRYENSQDKELTELLIRDNKQVF